MLGVVDLLLDRTRRHALGSRLDRDGRRRGILPILADGGLAVNGRSQRRGGLAKRRFGRDAGDIDLVASRVEIHLQVEADNGPRFGELNNLVELPARRLVAGLEIDLEVEKAVVAAVGVTEGLNARVIARATEHLAVLDVFVDEHHSRFGSWKMVSFMRPTTIAPSTNKRDTGRLRRQWAGLCTGYSR